MNSKFDELTKGMAQSVTRRAAFEKFSLGIAGMALACFGLANEAEAGKGNPCWTSGTCCSGGGGKGGHNSCNKCCNGYAPNAICSFGSGGVANYICQ